MASPAPPQPTPPPAAEHRSLPEEQERRQAAHEQDVEEREAYEYWGYLFKPDKTGTDKLKNLLRGLKDVINERYEQSDQPDLTPSQLASFYRDLHGNYDQLFLGTPSESISFIYKSLGCLHSLQPPAYTHATAFTDPTVPALKTEGWIMWQTIQLLLGPEEHSEFIREAVGKWDVKDHDTGELFPKILPKECFPLEPDRHMVAWYEGVSERLRKEAEDEERRHTIEVEHEPPPRRLQASERPPKPHGGGEPSTDDEGSVDSRGPALAYFRNPLYRHVDGRPSIVRRNSKRPALSPRQTMMDKGKEAVGTFGRFARNVGSPHLWDGRTPSRSRDRDGRRKSHPDNHHHHPDELPPPTSAGAYDNRYPGPRSHSGHSHGRRRSSQLERPERPVSGAIADEEWDAGDESPIYSPEPRRPTSDGSRHRHTSSHSHSRPESRDQSLRHSKSHEPTPTQKEGNDYFEGYDDPQRRRNSAHDKPPTPPENSFGPSFGPSASPLFASHVAKQPHPPRSQPGPPPPVSESYEGGAPLRNPSIRRAQGRYPSRSPDPGSRPPPPMDPRDRPPMDPRDRPPMDPRDRPPMDPRDRPDSRGPGPRERPPMDPRDRPDSRGPRDPRDRRYDSPRPPPRFDNSPAPYDDGPGGPPPPHSGPPMGSRYDAPPPRDPRDRDFRDRDPRDRRSYGGGGGGPGRMSGSDLDYSGEDRRSRPKQTRFADTGVSGRRYPDESPWGGERDRDGPPRRRS